MFDIKVSNLKRMERKYVLEYEKEELQRKVLQYYIAIKEVLKREISKGEANKVIQENNSKIFKDFKESTKYNIVEWLKVTGNKQDLIDVDKQDYFSLYKLAYDYNAGKIKREIGLDDWDNIRAGFCWQNLSKDFIRQIVEFDPVYKTQLEHELLLDIHGYSVHASFFYQNMYNYVKSGMAEQKQLKYYANEIYMMYRQQAERQFNISKQVYRMVDGTGRVLDQWVM